MMLTILTRHSSAPSISSHPPPTAWTLQNQMSPHDSQWHMHPLQDSTTRPSQIYLSWFKTRKLYQKIRFQMSQHHNPLDSSSCSIRELLIDLCRWGIAKLSSKHSSSCSVFAEMNSSLIHIMREDFVMAWWFLQSPQYKFLIKAGKLKYGDESFCLL